MKAVLPEKSTHIHARVQRRNTFMVCLLQVENCTSNCTQLYFVESIRKSFVLTDGTGSCCNGGLLSLFTSCSGLRSVFWTLSWSRDAAVTTSLPFAKLSHVTYVRTATDGNMSVVAQSKSGEMFLCPSHTLALIFVDLWSRVVWSRLWHRYYRIICANVGKKTSAKLWHLWSSLTACLQSTEADFVP